MQRRCARAIDRRVSFDLCDYDLSADRVRHNTLLDNGVNSIDPIRSRFQRKHPHTRIPVTETASQDVGIRFSVDDESRCRGGGVESARLIGFQLCTNTIWVGQTYLMLIQP